MSIDLDKLEMQLTDEEGRRLKFYFDTRGIPSIGIGRNLRDVGLTGNEVTYLFRNDIDRVGQELNDNLPWVLDLDDVRQRVFYDLCFNMGISKLLTFVRMLSYAQTGDFGNAAIELHHSIWDSQVGDRARRLESMLKTGEDP